MPLGGGRDAAERLGTLHDPGAAWMQQVGKELNQAATAIVTSRADGFGLRWFTATTELELCGHGTLASAHALGVTKSSGAVKRCAV